MLPKLLRIGLVHTPSVSESGKFLFQGFGAQQENRGTADEIFVMAKIYMAHSSFELHHLYDGRYRIQVKSVGKFANNINKIHCIKQTKKLFSRGLQFGHVRGGVKKYLSQIWKHLPNFYFKRGMWKESTGILLGKCQIFLEHKQNDFPPQPPHFSFIWNQTQQFRLKSFRKSTKLH